MKKDDGISILLSIVINLIIVLLIPGLSADKIENKKIKVGLVAYENKNRTKLEGNKNSNSGEKKNTQVLLKKSEPPKKKVEAQKVEKPVEKKQNEVKKQSNQVDLTLLNSIANSIDTPKVDVLSTPNSTQFREVQKLETPKKEFSQRGEVISSEAINKNINLSKELISAENEKLELKDEDRIAFNPEVGKDDSFDRILQVTGETEGLPSGYKLGTEDGDIVARWDSSNKEPVYPESAQLKGLHGSVKIRMSIDENGNVKKLLLEKGSGVPEINNAIEEVGRTWKIYLSKNGLSVKGDVILEYNFTLKGKIN